MSNMKTWFVYDKATGYVLSGFNRVSDSCSDGYNIFTRPYKYDFDFNDNYNCELDAIYETSKRDGLPNLKREDLVVTTTNETNATTTFIENPRYFKTTSKTEVRGWWKLQNYK